MAQKKSRLWAHFRGYIGRYTILSQRLFWSGRLSNRRLVSNVAMTLNQSLVVALLAPNWLLTQWGGEIGIYHFLGVAWLAVFNMNALAFKDLHWRTILAPGALHRGRLGLHILRSTVALQCATYLPLVALWVLVRWVGFNVPIADSVDMAWSYRIFALELFTATVLAVLLRAIGSGRTLAYELIVGAMIALTIIIVWPMWPLKDHTGLQVGTVYLLGLLSFATATLIVANRLWTVRKLAQFLRTGSL